MLQIPCDYIIGVCKKSCGLRDLDDDFPLKQVMLDLKERKKLDYEGMDQENNYIPTLFLAIRLMTEFKYHYDKPFGFTDPLDVDFFQAYLDYLRSLKFDGFTHWSAEDLSFYNDRNFKIKSETSRQE